MGILPVYLVRHEEAEPGLGIPDAHRALTAKGRARMRATGKLVRAHAEIDVIFTSPLVRAVQTAEILLQALDMDEPVFARDAVANPPSLDAIIDLFADIEPRVRGVAVVGHEPTLSELSALLLGLDMYPRSFKKGSVLGLDFDPSARKASLRWLIVGKGPELLRTLED